MDQYFFVHAIRFLFVFQNFGIAADAPSKKASIQSFDAIHFCFGLQYCLSCVASSLKGDLILSARRLYIFSRAFAVAGRCLDSMILVKTAKRLYSSKTNRRASTMAGSLF